MAPTMKDLSQITGLGLATISKYFNGGTVREKNRILIENAVKQLHFVPNEVARSLKTRRSHVIGVVIPELSNAFITSIISAMEDLLRRRNYAVIVSDCRSDPKREKEAVNFLLNRQVDGLINMPTDATGTHLKSAMAAGIPVVLVDRLIPALDGQVSAVVIDNVRASEKAIQELLNAGHRHIGLILGEPDLYTTNCRLQGYLNSLRAVGITPSQEDIRYANYTMNGGYQAVQQLMQQPDPPTALFITNFEMTIGGMLALQNMGIRVPEDLSVIGFDKLEMFGNIFPHLTLIHQPQHSIGQECANLILALLNEENRLSHRTVILNTQLTRGTSVHPPKQAEAGKEFA
ncbi:MAG: LacI family DNA-binding transcriptional regulator [Clostridia bacterium]|nr:LacI family DNA-binding transcriptional regulator [Clostridia bacterium]